MFEVGVYEYIHSLKTKIKIYHTGDPNSVINIYELNQFINDIYENIGKYSGPDIFSSLTVEVWDKNRVDIPKNIYSCNENVCTLKEYGIGSTSGLTWSNKSLIQLNNNTFGATDKSKFYSELVSHEFGHWYESFCGFADGSTICDKYWESIRAKDQDHDTSKIELFAEDFRYFFGSRYSKNIYRGDNKPANQVQGLKDLMKIGKPVKDYIKSLPFYLGVFGLDFYKSHTDFDYMRVVFYEYNYAFPFLSKWIKIDRFGVHDTTDAKNEKLIKSF